MEPQHVGETTQDLTNYTGQHQAYNMDHGYGMYGLGDRNRVKLHEEGATIFEERANDKIEKYLKKF